MACVNVADVRKILPTGTDLTDDAIEMALVSANCTVEELTGPDACLNSKSSTCIAQIIMYLAAHYAAVTDYTLSISSERDDCSKASVAYGFKFGEGILGTPFGQTANTLSGGCLAQLDKQPVGLFSIGSH